MELELSTEVDEVVAAATVMAVVGVGAADSVELAMEDVNTLF